MAPRKCPRRMRNPLIVNAGQLHVDIQPRVGEHPKDVQHIGPIMSVRTKFGVGTLEYLDLVVVGNHKVKRY